MRVAFVSENAQTDTRAFSGTPSCMAKAIRRQVESLDYIYAPMFDWESVFSNPEKTVLSLRETGRTVSRHLKALKIDAVICQGTSMIPFLETDKPIALWHDSTWESLLQLDFEEFSSCHPLLRQWDQMVFDKCGLVAFAADWLRDAALARYAVAPEQIDVVPFGANLEAPERAEVKAYVDNRQGKSCRLTFLGIDWIRKGAPAVYSLMDRLNRQGCPTTLTIIGNNGRAESRGDSENLLGLRLRGDKRVEILGFLDKTRPAHRERLHKALAETHFLVHPAQFECFGVALAEANAFGIPVLALDQFGPQSIVRDGINGHLFAPNTFVAKAAAQVNFYQNSFEDYRRLALLAFNEYQSRLNWDTAAAHFLRGLERLLSGVERVQPVPVPGFTGSL